MTMESQYIEKRNQNYYIKGSRVSLESVISTFKEGLAPETIVTECFPILSLEQVYGAITYYLANRDEMDTYLKRSDKEFESLRKSTQKSDPDFYKKLLKAKRNLQVKQA
jgi:uncharacterized protein (DUF433 family)